MQAEFEAAIDNFLELSRVTVDDLRGLLASQIDEQLWRRCFIRAAAATMEAHANLLADVSRALQSIDPLELPKPCQDVIDKRRMNTLALIKNSLAAGYACFRLHGGPASKATEWQSVHRFMKCRNALMHPKSAADFYVSDDDWAEVKDGFAWVFSQYNRLQELLLQEHGTSAVILERDAEDGE